jgi:hypothetical protein
LARLVRAPEPRLPGPGAYDNTDSGILYRGAWTLDNQFKQAANGTISYANSPGDGFRFEFEGIEVSWVYTKAPNRGMAAVSIDGEAIQTSISTLPRRWQSRTTYPLRPVSMFSMSASRRQTPRCHPSVCGC